MISDVNVGRNRSVSMRNKCWAFVVLIVNEIVPMLWKNCVIRRWLSKIAYDESIGNEMSYHDETF